MLNDSSTAHSMPKYSRQYSLEPSPNLSVSTTDLYKVIYFIFVNNHSITAVHHISEWFQKRDILEDARVLLGRHKEMEQEHKRHEK